MNFIHGTKCEPFTIQIPLLGKLWTIHYSIQIALWNVDDKVKVIENAFHPRDKMWTIHYSNSIMKYWWQG